MTETQHTIAAWAAETFPPTDGSSGVKAQALKLFHEAAELALACGWAWKELDCELGEVEPPSGNVWACRPEPDKVPAEAADVAIVLAVLGGRAGFDLQTEVDAKMHTNRHKRKWAVDASGKAQHIREEGGGR